MKLASPARALACTLALWGGLAGEALAAPACPPPMPTATAQALKAVPRDRGMLWRATRGGRSSYLFGTLHVGKPEWRRLGPQTSAALRESDVLALEIDAQDPGVSEAMAQPQAARPLPADLAQRLQQALQRACVPAESMTGLHPVWQVSLLTLLEARWLGMDPAYAQEHLLAAQARSQGMPVVSLETVATQTQALIPQGEDQGDQLLEQSLQQLQDQSGRRVLHKLARAWEAGDLAALEDYEAWCECGADAAERTFMQRLNDERNPRLADGIEARHAQGQRVFAAVGALHMTGPAGLPRLLRERGFRLERVNFRR
ncbi:MAG: TraB/GumN family protein [Rubrivivax sp.]|nr:TraB/GumN family protein [Rubrivivax sp.]